MIPDAQKRTSRRQFLKRVTASLAGFALLRADPAFHASRPDQASQLALVNLPGLAELPDPLVARVIDAGHPISEAEILADIEPQLVTLPVKMDGILAAFRYTRVHRIAIPALEALFSQANAARTGLFVHSAFRSYEQQAIAYSQAKDKAVVMQPGTSQHHTGLAIDFTSADIGKQIDIGLPFDSTKAGQWLNENAWQYGFVRSYSGNHDGIKDEPWHYLYVGEAMSTAYAQLKSGGWYGDVFLLQKAITLGFPRIVLET